MMLHDDEPYRAVYSHHDLRPSESLPRSYVIFHSGLLRYLHQKTRRPKDGEYQDVSEIDEYEYEFFHFSWSLKRSEDCKIRKIH